MRLRITPAAFADIDAILLFLGERSPEAADRIAERLTGAFEMLLVNLSVGRRTSEAGLRRLVLPRSPYLVFYIAQGDDLVIIAVRHAARRPESMPA